MDRSRAARRHRLGRLFDAWHLAALASSASSTAVVRGFRRRRDAATFAAGFRAWASLSWARRWRRRQLLLHGLEALASLAPPANHVRGGLTRSHLAGTAVGGGGVPARGVTVYDPEAVASAHRRRAGLSRGFRALLQTGGAELGTTRQFLFVPHGNRGERGGAVVRVSVVRVACRTWFEAASWRRRARGGADVGARAWRRNGLARAVRELRRLAVDASRQRRADRRSLLRGSFAAFRQVCSWMSNLASSENFGNLI